MRSKMASTSPVAPFPRENDLAERFGTTRLTVRNAIDALVAGGLLRRVQGKGVYVMSERLGEADALELVGFRESVREKNAVPSVKVLSKARRPAGGFFSHLFEIGENDDILAIKRVNYVDDVPLMIERTFIPISLFPKIESVDVGVSLFTPSLWHVWAYRRIGCRAPRYGRAGNARCHTC
jgi:GntR family transcriptional regulator